MGFHIQVGHPKIKRSISRGYDRILDAFKDIFREDEESAYLFWNEIPVRIRYREDLKKNFNDILAMIWLVWRDEQGASKTSFITPTLSMRWVLRWKDDRLTIDSEFVPGNRIYETYANALNRQRTVTVAKNIFLKEWHTLLHQIVVSLEKSKTIIHDGTERRRLELMQAVDKNIGGYGKLYERPSK